MKNVAFAVCFLSLFSGCKHHHKHFVEGNQYLQCSTNELGEVILDITVPHLYFALLSEQDANGVFGPSDAFVDSYVVNKGVRVPGTYTFRLELIADDQVKNKFLHTIIETCSVTVTESDPDTPPNDPPGDSSTDPTVVCSVNTEDGAVSVTVDLGDFAGPFTLVRVNSEESTVITEASTVITLNLTEGVYTFNLEDPTGVVVSTCSVTVPGDDCPPPNDDDNTPPPDLVTICHTSASGVHHTLVLPRPAADAHLLHHTEDTLGPCLDDTESCSVFKGSSRALVHKKHLEAWLLKHWCFCND